MWWQLQHKVEAELATLAGTVLEHRHRKKGPQEQSAVNWQGRLTMLAD